MCSRMCSCTVDAVKRLCSRCVHGCVHGRNLPFRLWNKKNTKIFLSSFIERSPENRIFPPWTHFEHIMNTSFSSQLRCMNTFLNTSIVVQKCGFFPSIFDHLSKIGNSRSVCSLYYSIRLARFSDDSQKIDFFEFFDQFPIQIIEIED